MRRTDLPVQRQRNRRWGPFGGRCDETETVRGKKKGLTQIIRSVLHFKRSIFWGSIHVEQYLVPAALQVSKEAPLAVPGANQLRWILNWVYVKMGRYTPKSLDSSYENHILHEFERMIHGPLEECLSFLDTPSCLIRDIVPGAASTLGGVTTQAAFFLMVEMVIYEADRHRFHR